MKNISRFSKLLLSAAVALSLASCGRSARVDITVADAPSSEVIVKLLDINRFKVLDTLTLDESGKIVYKMDVQKGEPEFVYLFRGEKKIASMILKSADKVSVEADTLGNFTVTGSQESLKLAQVEKDYADALSKMNSLARRAEDAVNPEYALSLRQDMGKTYLEYYRDRVRYVMENSTSLSVVPVFFQTLGAELPVFSQSTDAIHFRNVADSLAIVYPDSKYVKALRQEADKRFGYLELQTRIAAAESISYPEIELPDIKGEKRSLTDVDAKVILLQFWTASDVEQKMFNLDVLKPLYAEFNSKGFEIYQVSLDVDKGLWAQVVKEQKLPWISVCDSRGAESIYAMHYNIAAVPALFIIADGQLVDGSVVDETSLRKLIRDSLK